MKQIIDYFMNCTIEDFIWGIFIAIIIGGIIWRMVKSEFFIGDDDDD
jgi:CDP-diglyceride synthetase